MDLFKAMSLFSNQSDGPITTGVIDVPMSHIFRFPDTIKERSKQKRKHKITYSPQPFIFNIRGIRINFYSVESFHVNRSN